jgi:translation initiation factor IF-2
MAAVLEVVPSAVFSRCCPIVASVRVVKGPLVRQMKVSVSGTQKELGVIIYIYKGEQEVQEGVIGEVYIIIIEPPPPAPPLPPPSLGANDETLVCSL